MAIRFKMGYGPSLTKATAEPTQITRKGWPNGDDFLLRHRFSSDD